MEYSTQVPVLSLRCGGGLRADDWLAVFDRHAYLLCTVSTWVDCLFRPTNGSSSYIIFELPSNIIIRKVNVSMWLGTIALCWGTVMLGMTFLKHWWQLAICRALLGLFEAGFFPACTYLISTWYTRGEIQLRMTAFCLFAVFVAGFSSAIAGGISTLKGKAGLNSWQWIFVSYFIFKSSNLQSSIQLLEGIASVIVAILAYLFVVDFPEHNKFLTADETRFIIRRLEEDRGDVEMDHWTWNKFFNYLFSPKLWAFGIILGAATTVSYAFVYFLPIILVGMGFSYIHAQLLVAPPYFVSVFVALGFAYIGDKYMIRAPMIMFQAVLSILGLSIVSISDNVIRLGQLTHHKDRIPPYCRCPLHWSILGPCRDIFGRS
jgi:MFS family permease